MMCSRFRSILSSVLSERNFHESTGWGDEDFRDDCSEVARTIAVKTVHTVRLVL